MRTKDLRTLIASCAVALLTLTAVAGTYPEIKIGDLKSAIAAKKVTLIDVNGTESWKAGHIPSAIDFQANKDQLASLLPKDKDALVVAYCGNPRCSAYQAAAKAAKELGYTNVKHFAGGISGWKQAGEKVEQPG